MQEFHFWTCAVIPHAILQQFYCFCGTAQAIHDSLFTVFSPTNRSKEQLVPGAIITKSLVRRRLGSPKTNRNVFSNWRNSPSSMSGCRRSGSMLFQIRGPAAEKLRSPKRIRVLGMMHVSTCPRPIAFPSAKKSLITGLFWWSCSKISQGLPFF